MLEGGIQKVTGSPEKNCKFDRSNFTSATKFDVLYFHY